MSEPQTTPSGAAETSEPGASDVDLGKYALGAIAVVTAASGLVGGLTGGVARLARNGAWWLPAIVLGVFLAACLALASTFVKPKARPQSVLLLSALVVFGVASAATALSLSMSLARSDRPVISASWQPGTQGWVLRGTVTASGLKAEDRVFISVARTLVTPDRVPAATLPTGSTSRSSPTVTVPRHDALYAGTVYQQVVGADIEGKTSVAFEVPLSPLYGGLQVSANINNSSMDCPRDPSRESTGDQGAPVETPSACLILDAPTWLPSATPTTRSS